MRCKISTGSNETLHQDFIPSSAQIFLAIQFVTRKKEKKKRIRMSIFIFFLLQNQKLSAWLYSANESIISLGVSSQSDLIVWGTSSNVNYGSLSQFSGNLPLQNPVVTTIVWSPGPSFITLNVTTAVTTTAAPTMPTTEMSSISTSNARPIHLSLWWEYLVMFSIIVMTAMFL